MGKIQLTPLARQDLEDIWVFIAQDDPAAVDRLPATPDERIALLADNPLMGPARPDIARELRYHPVGNHLLLYRIVGDGIEVVRVVHGARNLLNLL